MSIPKEINKQGKEDLLSRATDYIYANSNEHLRERWAVQLKDEFILIEGNTDGFFIARETRWPSEAFNFIRDC
jgi:hypothetical protein